MTNQKHYTKDLTKITSVRLSANLLDQGIKCADSLDMTFSDFIRQSIIKNVSASTDKRAKNNQQNFGHII
jgi:hypothetical protein